MDKNNSFIIFKQKMAEIETELEDTVTYPFQEKQTIRMNDTIKDDTSQKSPKGISLLLFDNIFDFTFDDQGRTIHFPNPIKLVEFEKSGIEIQLFCLTYAPEVEWDDVYYAFRSQISEVAFKIWLKDPKIELKSMQIIDEENWTETWRKYRKSDSAFINHRSDKEMFVHLMTPKIDKKLKKFTETLKVSNFALIKDKMKEYEDIKKQIQNIFN